MAVVTIDTPADAPPTDSRPPSRAQPIGVQWLNDRFRDLSPRERIRLFFSSPVLTSPRVLVTSSFGTTAALLLHMLKDAGVDYPIYFLNTSFHFLETLEYKETLTRQLDLDVRVLRAAPPDLRRTLETGLWSYDPEGCCNVNKVRPLARVITSRRYNPVSAVLARHPPNPISLSPKFLNTLYGQTALPYQDELHDRWF